MKRPVEPRWFVRTIRTLLQVLDERERQNEKWGDQSHHPDATGPGTVRALARELHMETLVPDGISDCEAARQMVDRAFMRGKGSWALILFEEVVEALEEEDEEALEMELTQGAAVATDWAEALQRRREAMRDA